MRSLIILEVEHGEDIDSLSEFIGWADSSAFETFSGLNILSSTVKVDIPDCFELEK